MAYDVFISYRRKGGGEFAAALYQSLIASGLNTFFDREELRFIDFRRQLVTNNLKSRVLVVLLSKDALSYERCKNKNDWLRRELELFLKLKKKIVFVKFDDFELPDKLPPSLKKVKKLLQKNKNVITYNSNDYFSRIGAIDEVKALIMKEFSTEVREELKNSSMTKAVSGRLSEEQLHIKKDYKTYSEKTTCLNVLYLFLLIVISISLMLSDIESNLGARAILSCYLIFVVGFKRREVKGFHKDSWLYIMLDIFVEGAFPCIGFFILCFISGFVLLYFLPSIIVESLGIFRPVEAVSMFLISFLSTLFSLFIGYEFIKSAMHMVNASISIHFSKMIKRKMKISFVADKIIPRKVSKYDKEKQVEKNKFVPVVLSIVISVLVELFLIQTLPDYWS